jgi:hypothetical protein
LRSGKTVGDERDERSSFNRADSIANDDDRARDEQ